MKIAIVMPAIIPPSLYGGTERVVYWLAQRLHQLGHQVVVLAASGSTINMLIPGVELIEIDGLLSDYRRLLPDNTDVVHFFHISRTDPPPDIPYISTVEGNDLKGGAYYWPNTVFVSASHARFHGGSYYVFNGLPKKDYPLTLGKKNYMLFLAKLGWRLKNAKTAINLSLDTNTPLMLTGGWLRREPKTWGSWIFRRPFHPGLISNAGMVGSQRKLELIQNANILFYAVNWHEPFGIAPHEALSCGVPVIATPNGALAEYIEDGKNGYIVRSYAEAVEALQRFKDLPDSEIRTMREYCHESAYSVEQMTDEYLKLYRKVIDDQWLYLEKENKTFRYRPEPHVVIKK